MKNILIITCVLFAICGSVPAQNRVFTGGRQLDSGQGDDQESEVYEMAGPYALRWSLMDVQPSKSEDPYWKPRTSYSRNPPWISIRVYDAKTRRLIEQHSMDGRENQMAVSQGGKHYLVVTSYDDLKWTIWGLEGVFDVGGLRSLRPADTGGGEAASSSDGVIASLKSQFSGRELDERLAAVKLIESRSVSADDFSKRWKAYCQVQGW